MGLFRCNFGQVKHGHSSNKMSADLQWSIIRNNSCFLLKGSGQTFSTEASNLRGRNSFRFNGLVRERTVGVEPCADGKGVVLVTKKSTGYRKPSKRENRVELKSGSRATLNTIRTTIRKGSAILKSQKPVVPRKVRGQKKKE